MNDGYIFCDYIQSHVGTEGNEKTVSIKNNVSGSIRVKREIGCWSSSTGLYNNARVHAGSNLSISAYGKSTGVYNGGNISVDGRLGINTTRSNTSRGYQGSGSISYSEKYEYNDLQE